MDRRGAVVGPDLGADPARLGPGRRGQLGRVAAGAAGLRFAALAVALFALAVGPPAVAAAQAATPNASPAAGGPAALLFAQTFAAGTWAPKPGAADVFELTLTGHVDQTVWFSDRPERLTGALPTAELLAGPLFDPADPPNAALVVRTAGGEEDVLVVELGNPRYDAAAGTLSYDAAPLAGNPGGGLAELAGRQQDAELPASFGPGALFIDSIWCILDPRPPC
ncbi:MAG: hypothetical protein AVDCRST_MAG59-4129 [uncultured Thermomicrobiales bacterium]|uniref:Uncharacterized protein n=1 Tax=uncultured Thermomicrobiales bacterium TaxID=1645740 RepID=A0A6J4VEQ4_9BACT|nr:MAG: hypothetical protein AVDCRST_MAG59-4129 [uncultured Thermomicrobiales bacterium]